MNRLPDSYWYAALCLVWLLAGLIGHAPWKGPDSETFAILLAVQQQSDWLLPGGDDVYYLPPLYLWAAQAMGTLLSPILPLHDAVRLTSGLFVGFTFLLLSLAARVLYGTHATWPAVIALMGCVGLLIPAHEINPHTAQLASVALLVFGLAWMLKRPLTGGGLAGLGIAALFLSGSWLAALALAIALLLLPVLFSSWRTSARVGGSWFALTAALALCGAWLAAVQAQDAAGLAAWWQQEGLSETVFQRDEKTRYNPLYFLNALSWFAWPAWPLAGWAVYRLRREGWDSVKLWMPLGVFCVTLIALSLQSRPSQIQSIILLPPLALLAAAGLTELRRGAANALLWFSFMTFSLFAVGFWVYWAAFDLGWPGQIAKRLVKLGMESQGLRPLALALGLVISLAWVGWLAWMKYQPRTPQRPVLAWSAGVTFVWCLLLALFMRPLDARLSYANLGQAIRSQIAEADCVATKNVGLMHRELLRYHSGLDVSPEASPACGWLLVLNKSRKQESPGPGWTKRWEGGLPGERNERFWLYKRQG